MTTLIYHPGVVKTDLIVLVGLALYITEGIMLNKGNKLITSTPTTVFIHWNSREVGSSLGTINTSGAVM